MTGLLTGEALIEAQELCHARLEMKKLLYPRPFKVQKNVSVPHGTIYRRGGIEKKSVRITIDPNTEIIKDSTLEPGRVV